MPTWWLFISRTPSTQHGTQMRTCLISRLINLNTHTCIKTGPLKAIRALAITNSIHSWAYVSGVYGHTYCQYTEKSPSLDMAVVSVNALNHNTTVALTRPVVTAPKCVPVVLFPGESRSPWPFPAQNVSSLPLESRARPGAYPPIRFSRRSIPAGVMTSMWASRLCMPVAIRQVWHV